MFGCDLNKKYLSAKFQTVRNVQRLVEVEHRENHPGLHSGEELFQGFCQVFHQPLVSKLIHLNGQLDVVEEICFVSINISVKQVKSSQ
jgi:hypothetical protein